MELSQVVPWLSVSPPIHFQVLMIIMVLVINDTTTVADVLTNLHHQQKLPSDLCIHYLASSRSGLCCLGLLELVVDLACGEDFHLQLCQCVHGMSQELDDLCESFYLP